MTDRRRNTLVLGVVAGLFLVSLLVIIGIPGAVKGKKTRLGLDLKGGVELIYQGSEMYENILKRLDLAQ